jgi:bidirectional [NiFe] hydrogenase diaphorase subunit
MHDILDRIIKKQATQKDLVLLEDLCDMVRNTSLCGLGMTAPNPVVSTLRYFRHEYESKLVSEDVLWARGHDNGQTHTTKLEVIK